MTFERVMEAEKAKREAIFQGEQQVFFAHQNEAFL